MNLDYVQIYLQSNILEWPAYWFLGRRYGFGRVFLTVSLFNLITHPSVFFVIMRLPMSFLTVTLLAEAFAIVAETFLARRYFSLSPTRAFTVSLIANLLSWQFGPVVTYLRFF